MKKFILLILILGMLTACILGGNTVQALDFEYEQVLTKTLAWQDNDVRGDGWVGGNYTYDTLDTTIPFPTWEVDSTIVIVGSEVYAEVDPSWRPDWHTGRIECETELWLDIGGIKHTLNKKDLKIATYVTETSSFITGELVDHSTIMFPAGTGAIMRAGDTLHLSPDGFNLSMEPHNSCSMYFRAYVFYVELD